MKLFSSAAAAMIEESAKKSKAALAPPPKVNSSKLFGELPEISKKVQEYFKGSPAILISTEEELHDYISHVIDAGYCGIDTETTGLDRVKDYIVGTSLYYPGGVECYIPIRHRIPLLEEPYKGQLTYEQVRKEYQRLADNKVKLIFANADFDLAMIYKDLKVDFSDTYYYDVILAWRCLKENEKDNALKVLYNKYVLKGHGDPMKFNDFFSPTLFPYCDPKVAKLYAANDAKITYELFKWQLPYVTKSHPKCQKHHLEAISDLIWNVEMPLIKVCHHMHRSGIYLDKKVADRLNTRYRNKYLKELKKLYELVQAEIEKSDYSTYAKRPFAQAQDFNPGSPVHVKYLIYTMMKIPASKNGGGTGKEVLADLNLPVTNQILKVRSLLVLINTFVKKLPAATTLDSRIHAQFKQIGANTGRLSSADPNMQNIPSHATDIRHLFRATASHDEIVDCSYDGSLNTITVHVGKFNTVTTPTRDIAVKDLSVGDSVKLIEDGKECWKDVKAISTSDEDPCVCDVVF